MSPCDSLSDAWSREISHFCNVNQNDPNRRTHHFSSSLRIQRWYLHQQRIDRNIPRSDRSHWQSWSELNSLNAISTTALDEASALDAHFAATSNFIGPLHGIPVIVKDQVETKGIATTFGSIIAKDHVTDRDATVVKKLKEAGAIVLAKSTMPGMFFKSTKSLNF